MELNKKFSKILVTGAPGWLGTRLVECLATGLPDNPQTAQPIECDEIRVLTLSPEGTDELKKINPKITCVVGDVSNASDVEKWMQGAEGSLIFHIAGIIHPSKQSDFEKVNHQGTVNLLNSAEKNSVKKIVVMSSNSPFGTNPHSDHRFDESSPYNPYMGYGLSKMKMEIAVQQISKKGVVETAIIRAPWFYGPNQPARQSLFFSMIKDGKAPIVGSGENMRSMSYIDNLCQGLILAAIHPQANGKAYWIADERPYSMNEVVDTIEQLMEKSFGMACTHKRMRLPGIASEVAYAVDMTLQKLGLYHQKIHVLSEMNKNIACDISLAKKELGYQPKYDLKQGMHASIKWAVDRKELQ